MKMTFAVRPHKINPGETVVEVFDEDKLVATIYPFAKGVKIVSKHLRTPRQMSFDNSAPPFAVEVRLQ